jgi:hypothetical protein
MTAFAPTHFQTPLTAPSNILSEEVWRKQRDDHYCKLAPWVIPHLKRHDLGEEHAVYDFLFGYFSFRASLLMRWSPGADVFLEGNSAVIFLQNSQYTRACDKVCLDPKAFPQHRLPSAQWALALLEKINERPPQYGCAGLHEWAMECGSEVKRYPNIPLRMKSKELQDFVSSQDIRCSHYDAFRFFTPQAKPFNRLQPGKSSQGDFEQSGCLHVNMDLYKWAYKFYPWIGSNLIAETFLLALEARQIDMRASPYDLTRLGFEPIPIETIAGKAEYQRLQSSIYEKARPIRQKLIEAYHAMIEWALPIDHLSRTTLFAAGPTSYESPSQAIETSTTRR